MNLQYGNHKLTLFRVTSANTNQTKLSVKMVLLNGTKLTLTSAISTY